MYRLNRERNLLEEITETTFYESNLKERQHIEEWLRKILRLWVRSYL